MPDAGSVLVVGAGPVGLTVAIGLRRRGIPVRIIDRAPEPAAESRALGIQARTLEVLPEAIVADLLAAGNRIARVRLAHGGRVLGRVDLSGAATEFSHILALGQQHVERILLAHLVALDVEVERGRTVEGLIELPNCVRAEVREADGLLRHIDVAALIGCDGVASTVRSLTGLDGAARRDDRSWMLADVIVETATPPDEALISFGVGEVAAMFPLSADGALRRVVVAPRSPVPSPLDAEAVQLVLDGVTGGGVRILRGEWFSTFRIREHVARRFRAGRVLLAGDAAHAHSPLGAQGMNLGMQDAVALVDLLAPVLEGAVPWESLDAYDAERRPIARRIVAITGRATALALRPSRSWARVRAGVLRRALRVPAIRRRVRDTLLMLGREHRQHPQRVL